jgi:hypothetical protein
VDSQRGMRGVENWPGEQHMQRHKPQESRQCSADHESLSNRAGWLERDLAEGLAKVAEGTVCQMLMSEMTEGAPPPKSSCVGSLVLRAATVRAGGTFKRWVLVGHDWGHCLQKGPQTFSQD